jgi:AraC family transcriptional regulator
MFKPYNLTEKILLNIENRLQDGIRTDLIADEFNISSRHLERLFKFTYNQSIGSYIRSRKLAASINDLLNTNLNVLDIALNYGFKYEQSYIRSFKQEYGITPGALRKPGQIVKIKPLLHLFDENRLDNSVFFGQEIVMVPQFHVIGRRHLIPYNDSIYIAPKVGKQFWENERGKIADTAEQNVYIGIIEPGGINADYHRYLPSVPVRSLKIIPQGLDSYTFNPSLCVKFRYIGQHNFLDIFHDKIINIIHSAIEKSLDGLSCFSGGNSDNSKTYYEYGRKFCRINGSYFVKISGSPDKNFYQVEWVIPIKKMEMTKNVNFISCDYVIN